MTITVVNSLAEFNTAVAAYVDASGDEIRLAAAFPAASLAIGANKNGLILSSESADVVINQITVTGSGVEISGFKLRPAAPGTTGSLLTAAGSCGSAAWPNKWHGLDIKGSVVDFNPGTFSNSEYPIGQVGGGDSDSGLIVPDGIRTAAGAENIFYGEIYENTIADCVYGARVRLGGADAFVDIYSNDVTRCYTIGLAIDIATAAAFPGTTIARAWIHGNDISDWWFEPQDHGNPHGEPCCIFSNPLVENPPTNCAIFDNFAYQNLGTRGSQSGIFVMQDATTDTPFIAPMAFGNVSFARTGNGILLGPGSAGYMWGNTVLAVTPENQVRETENGYAADDNESAANGGIPRAPIGFAYILPDIVNDGCLTFSGDNVHELNSSKDGLVNNGHSNVVVGKGLPTIPYSTTNFPNFASPASANYASAQAMFDGHLAATAGKGAIRSGETYAAWRARRRSAPDFTDLPAWWGRKNKSAQPKSTPTEQVRVTSGVCPVTLGPGLTATWTVTNGRGRVSDDYSGANPGAWGTTGTINHGQGLELDVLMAETDTTETEATLTLDKGLGNVETFTWKATTLSTLSSPRIAIGTEERFEPGANFAMAGANGGKITVAVLGFKRAANPAVSTVVFGQGSPIRISILTTGFIRFEAYNSSNTLQKRADSTIDVCDGNPHDILFTTDFANSQIHMFVDGTEIAGLTAPATSASYGFTNVTGFPFGGNSTQGNLGFEIDGFLVWPNTYVDITDPTVRSTFSRGLLGEAGQGVTGGTKAAIALIGTAAAWNDAAGINRGSLATKWFVTAGQAVTASDANVWPAPAAYTREVLTEAPYLKDAPIECAYHRTGYMLAAQITETHNLIGTSDANPISIAEGGPNDAPAISVFTPSQAGTLTIGSTNDGGYDDPVDTVLTVEAFATSSRRHRRSYGYGYGY